MYRVDMAVDELVKNLIYKVVDVRHIHHSEVCGHVLGLTVKASRQRFAAEPVGRLYRKARQRKRQQQMNDVGVL